MKSFVKENGKIVLTAVITSIICISGTTFAARMMNAKDILFTATNANFKAGNVNEAIDSLYNEAQKEQKYSTEEQVVGTWTDGKPIYRKVFYLNTIKTTGNSYYDWFNDSFTIEDIDNLVNYNHKWKLESGTWYAGTEYFGLGYRSTSVDSAMWQADIIKIDTSININLAIAPAWETTKVSKVVLLEYTKKTD